MVIFGIKDVGGANAVLPIAIEFTKKGDSSPILYAGEVSLGTYKASYPLIPSDFPPQQLLDWFKPEIIITTPNAQGEVIPTALIKAAQAREINVVVVETMWAEHRMLEWPILPSAFCVQDSLAKKLILESWPTYPQEKVFVTGQPAFDYLSLVDCTEAKIELKKTLSLDQDWPIVIFIGGAQGTDEAFSLIVESLNLLGKPVYLFPRQHPTLSAPDASEELKKINKTCLNLMKTLRYGEVVDSSDIKFSKTIMMSADIVVSMFSTMLIEACYLGKTCVSVWPSGVQSAFDSATNNTLRDFPLVTMGSCLQGKDLAELMGCLEKIFLDDTTQIREVQRNHFKADGQSARRVYDIVQQLIQNR